jgi:hypothetical protein
VPIVSVPEAARQLGISERAVRFRISSGALAATRTGQGWQVTLPAAEVSGSAVVEGGSPAATEAVGGNGAVGHGGSEGGSAEAGAVGATALDLALAEIADLRARLDAHQQAEAELRRLLAAALQQRALPAPTSSDSGSASEIGVKSHAATLPRPW